MEFVMTWIKEHKSELFAIAIVVLCTLYWTLYESDLLILITAALALIAAALLFFRNEEFFCLFLMLLPNTMMIKLQWSPSALLGYFAILFALKLILFDRKKIAVDNRIAALVLVQLVSVAITVIKNQNVSFIPSLVRLLGAVVAALWLIGSFGENPALRKKLLMSFVFGCVLNAISTTVYHGLVAEALGLKFFAGINNDRNYFSIALAVGMQFALVDMLARRRFEISNCVYLLILLYGGIRSASRTFLVLCVPALILFVLLLGNLENKKQMRFVPPALAVLLAVTVVSPVGARLMEVIKRFTGENVLSANKRTDEWAFYLARTFSSIPNALFGAGTASRVIAAGEYKLAEHSTYVQALFETGICGLASFVAVFLSLTKRLRTGAMKFSAYLPLLTLLVGYSMLSAYYSDIFNYSLLLCLVVLSLPELRREAPVEGRLS